MSIELKEGEVECDECNGFGQQNTKQNVENVMELEKLNKVYFVVSVRVRESWTGLSLY